MCMSFACMCNMCMQISEEARRGWWSPWNWSPCEPTELVTNSNPLQKQQVLWTTEPPVQLAQFFPGSSSSYCHQVPDLEPWILGVTVVFHFLVLNFVVVTIALISYIKQRPQLISVIGCKFLYVASFDWSVVSNTYGILKLLSGMYTSRLQAQVFLQTKGKCMCAHACTHSHVCTEPLALKVTCWAQVSHQGAHYFL